MLVAGPISKEIHGTLGDDTDAVEPRGRENVDVRCHGVHEPRHLNLSSSTGSVGDTVTVTGSSFSVPRSADAPLIPVVLSWNGADGPVLAEATPDSAGNISATFSVPEGELGYYVIVASQKDAEGVDQYGTPARASYQIFGPNGESVVQPAGSQTPAVPAEPSSSGMIALTVGLGVLGLALFAAGFTAFVRQARGRAVPVPSKVRSE